MCGRYRFSRRKEVLAEHFGADFEGVDWEPRYNIAPTQSVPVIRRDVREGNLKATMMRWGLIPSWASDSKIGWSNINARSETVADKPSFRDPLRTQRCLIPADGFYEWQRTGKQRQPYCFEVGENKIFAFAGLWDRWQTPDGAVLETCTILTTEANALFRDIHNRMPVMLPTAHYGDWLDSSLRDVKQLTVFLRTFDSDSMRSYPVSTRINSVTNDDVQCSVPIDPLPLTNTLFD